MSSSHRNRTQHGARRAAGGALPIPRGLLAGALLFASVTANVAVARAAALTGPIDGGVQGRPFTAATFDLAPHGYVEEEFFFDGEATTYDAAPGTSLGVDGRWSLVPAGSVPFRTRLLVRRPADAARFNGTVLVEWLNVSGGWDIDAVWIQVRDEVLRSGYAWVGVSAQKAGVNGPAVLPGVSKPLVEWDPERYGTLAIEDDAQSYDVFTQAAALLGRTRPRAVDPLGGLAVERVLATGASQSAHRLASYLNGVQPLARAFDGFLVVVRFGSGARIHPALAPPERFRIRDDLAAPVFVVNTETEALATYPVRQPDTDRYRYWEIAGAAHQGTYVDATIDAQIRRDLGFALPACDPPANDMPAHHVMLAALHHLDRWVASTRGTHRLRTRAATSDDVSGRGATAVRPRRVLVPPRLEPITIAGDPPEIQRDEHGNALGGVRLPYIEVPTAQYGPVGTPEALRCDLRGFTIPFDAAKRAALYPSRTSYLRRFSSATFAARRRGYLLLPEALLGKRSVARVTRD